MKVGDRLYCIKGRDNGTGQTYLIIGNTYKIIKIIDIYEIDEYVKSYKVFDENDKIILVSVEKNYYNPNVEFYYNPNHIRERYYNLGEYFDIKKIERRKKLEKLNETY